MINFEEELKKFEPSLEVEEAEDAIHNHDFSDMTDILQEMIQEAKPVELKCHFCNSAYEFSTEDLKELLRKTK